MNPRIPEGHYLHQKCTCGHQRWLHIGDMLACLRQKCKCKRFTLMIEGKQQPVKPPVKSEKLC